MCRLQNTFCLFNTVLINGRKRGGGRSSGLAVQCVIGLPIVAHGGRGGREPSGAPSCSLPLQSGVESRGEEGTPRLMLGSLSAYHPQTRAPQINVAEQKRSAASAVEGCGTAIRSKLRGARWGSEAWGPGLANPASSHTDSHILPTKPC
jgi:hypothetical protein